MAWQPTPEQITAALDHAGLYAPRETCGVIAGGTYCPIANLATEHDAFVMDMRGYVAVACEHQVEAIVHSHVGLAPVPSEADRAMCEKLGLPWLIVSVPSGAWSVIEPSGWRAPLVGRDWAWGCQDCLGIVRDGLAANGITVPDFPRDWRFWDAGEDLIAEQFDSTGFHALPAGTLPEHLDVFGIQMPGSPVVNHLALFLAPDQILHQLVGRPSRRDLYDGRWQSLTRLHLRYGGA
jgi:proteasome lid subunit RPN8/RPN11